MSIRNRRSARACRSPEQDYSTWTKIIVHAICLSDGSKEAARHFCERPFLSDAWLSCAGTGELAPEIGFSKSDRESGRLTGEMGAHTNFRRLWQFCNSSAGHARAAAALEHISAGLNRGDSQVF